MPDLIELFNKLAVVLPSATTLVYTFIGLAGLTIGILALADAYQHAIGEVSPRLPSKGSIPFRLLLAGAMVVSPLLLWRAANTFVLGGNRTYDMFSYVEAGENTPYCDLFHQSLTYFFMFIGSIAIATAAVQANGIATGRNNKSAFGPVVFFIGGVLCFFIDDVGAIIGNTVGMDITLENICANLSPAATP